MKMHNLILYGTCFLLSANLSFISPAYADPDCRVRDVIKHVEDGLSRNQIRKEWENRIDVAKCSLSQVISMVEDGDSARYIYKRCRKPR